MKETNSFLGRAIPAHRSMRYVPGALTLIAALAVTGCERDQAEEDDAEQSEDEAPKKKKKSKKAKAKNRDDKKDAPTKKAVWTDSSGKERPLTKLSLDADEMGNSCFPGLSVMAPEGAHVKGEFAGACVITDDEELSMYFEYSLDPSNSFMVLDKRGGAQVIEETKTRLVVKKKDGFVAYDYQKWEDGYRHCSNQGEPVATKELLDQVLAICASAVHAD